MLRRTRWRVVEEPCRPGDAAARWEAAARAGATGAVTTWGAGIPGRELIRLYWEVSPDAEVPEGEDLVEQNWTPCWRQTLSAVAVTPRVALVPAWEAGAPPAPITLRVDPGMAFGAGDHPTTRLCVRVLDELALAGDLPPRLLDVGTGTGVLALVSACLGATAVDALDIDPFGFAACRRNAHLNGLSAAVRPVLLSLDLLAGVYPLVVANIVAGQLQVLAPLLRERVAPGGRLLVSGFEERDEQRVRDHVLGPFVLEARLAEEGWLALLGRDQGGSRAAS